VDTNLSKILHRPQRRRVDPETFGRADRRQWSRQQLRGKGPQQMRLAVQQIGQRRRAQRPHGKIGRLRFGVTDAARPAARIAGARLGKAPTRIAREAKMDQDQVVEIPGFQARETGDERRAKADR
jgi:hypothetical protein